MCPCVCVCVRYTLFVPRGTNISHTQERGGDKHFLHMGGRGGQTFFTHRGDKHFLIKGGDKHFMFEAVVAIFMLMEI